MLEYNIEIITTEKNHYVLIIVQITAVMTTFYSFACLVYVIFYNT